MQRTGSLGINAARGLAAIGLAGALLLGSGCGRVEDAAAASTPGAARANGTGHTLDLTGVRTPDRPVSGRLGGNPFTLERVEWHALTSTVLLHGTDGSTIFVFLFLDKGAPLPGVEKVIERAREGYDQPHVHVHFPYDAGRDVLMYTEEFAMRLRFGKTSRDGTVPASLYLCLPDDDRSWIAGTFDVPLE